MPAVLGSRPSGSELAKKSWVSVRSGFRRMPALYLLLLAAYLLLAAASFYAHAHSGEVIRFLGGDASSPFLQSAYYEFCWFIYWLPKSFALTVAAVAMHRFILLDEVGGMALLPTSIYVRRFYGAVLAIGLLTLIPFVAARVLARLLPSLSALFALAAIFSGIFIFVRSTMVFPAVAIGEFRSGLLEQIEVSWRQTDGQFWLFLRGALRIAWPFILLIVLLVMAGRFAPIAGITGWPDFSSTLSYKLLDNGLISLVVSVLDVGLASWLYAWVRQAPAELEFTS